MQSDGVPGDRDGPDDEVLRRALYRPGATKEDVERFLDRIPQPSSPPVATVAEDEDGPRQNSAASAIPMRAARILLVITAVIVLAVAAARTTAPDNGLGSDEPRDSSSAVLPVAADSGTSAGARGRAVETAPGRFRYTIARGDTVPAIADRFNLCRADAEYALLQDTGSSTPHDGDVVELVRRSDRYSICQQPPQPDGLAGPASSPRAETR